jgi:hypothetical protein
LPPPPARAGKKYPAVAGGSAGGLVVNLNLSRTAG